MTTTREQSAAALQHYRDAHEWLAMCNTEHATNPTPANKQLTQDALTAARAASRRLQDATDPAARLTAPHTPETP